MITTRFLTITEHYKYAPWLKSQDDETRQMYFGVHQTDETIDILVNSVLAKPKEHNFLVAEYKGNWIGTIHLAESNIDEIEFGVIVSKEHRGNGIADRLIDEAIVWARNRGYQTLYMHCLTWNQPIKHLCTKHGLEFNTKYSESETKMPLPPPDFKTVTQEMVNRNRNIYRMFLQKAMPFFEEVYG
jgi:GNAT superfamily N-acetyltransferase